MKIEDRLVEDQDFYVRVQKLKIAVMLGIFFIVWIAA